MDRTLGGQNILIIGNATRDAEAARVGEKKTYVCKFSLATGKRPDTTTVYRNCTAWTKVGKYASCIRKGDIVMVIGRLESREHNGKTYENVICEIVFILPNVVLSDEQPEQSNGFQQADDDELPF